jgi:hypothetical protein
LTVFVCESAAQIKDVYVAKRIEEERYFRRCPHPLLRRCPDNLVVYHLNDILAVRTPCQSISVFDEQHDEIWALTL